MHKTIKKVTPKSKLLSRHKRQNLYLNSKLVKLYKDRNYLIENDLDCLKQISHFYIFLENLIEYVSHKKLSLSALLAMIEKYKLDHFTFKTIKDYDKSRKYSK